MKATAKQFTSFGSLGLVQLLIEPEAQFLYKPAGPEIKNGGLIITESAGGIVGQLIAINNTGDYLLLSDADVLTGAKQNRVLNRSMLLAPMSKSVLDVSCVERLRWHFTSEKFSSPDSVAGQDLRKKKAGSFIQVSDEIVEGNPDTQRVVWSHIHERIMEQKCPSRTESYSDLVRFCLEKSGNGFPACEPEKGCNGLALIIDRKFYSADLFGREDVYRYYFPMLRDAAFLMAGQCQDEKPADIHEAFYKTLEAIDNLGTAARKAEPGYTGAGTLSNLEGAGLTGFDLTFQGQMIHDAIFGTEIC